MPGPVGGGRCANAPATAPTEDTCLADWWDWRLDIHCRHCGSIHYPVKLLSRRLAGNPTIGNVLDRLVCKKCQSRPDGVVLVDNPARRHRSYSSSASEIGHRSTPVDSPSAPPTKFTSRFP